MTTYLLTWNPAHFPWEDLDKDINTIKSEGHLSGNWSCGSTKKIVSTDRVFLIKLGAEPRGIVASGFVISDVYEDEHWDEDKRNAGINALYVKVDFDTILNPDMDIFQREWLTQGIYTKVHWSPQGGGITIPDDVAEQLELDWARFLNKPVKYEDVGLAEELSESATYPVGAVRRVTINAYERNPKARSACIKHHGVTCSVCGADFAEIYGSIGAGFIHVHHLIPISQLKPDYLLDPIKDLRPVCPNCHAMLHQQTPPYSIAEMKAMIERLRK